MERRERESESIKSKGKEEKDKLHLSMWQTLCKTSVCMYQVPHILQMFTTVPY